jgi:hypothetical protein
MIAAGNRNEAATSGSPAMQRRLPVWVTLSIALALVVGVSVGGWISASIWRSEIAGRAAFGVTSITCHHNLRRGVIDAKHVPASPSMAAVTRKSFWAPGSGNFWIWSRTPDSRTSSGPSTAMRDNDSNQGRGLKKVSPILATSAIAHESCNVRPRYGRWTSEGILVPLTPYPFQLCTIPLEGVGIPCRQVQPLPTVVFDQPLYGLGIASA